MIKSITKVDVIKALQKEPLKRGLFFRSDKKNCMVCVVGAVLRYMSFEKWARTKCKTLLGLGSAATYNRNIGIDPMYLVESENYLGALSCYFEDGHTIKQCIAFVKKYFPNKLTIKITEEDIENVSS